MAADRTEPNNDPGPTNFLGVVLQGGTAPLTSDQIAPREKLREVTEVVLSQSEVLFLISLSDSERKEVPAPATASEVALNGSWVRFTEDNADILLVLDLDAGPLQLGHGLDLGMIQLQDAVEQVAGSARVATIVLGAEMTEANDQVEIAANELAADATRTEGDRRAARSILSPMHALRQADLKLAQDRQDRARKRRTSQDAQLSAEKERQRLLVAREHLKQIPLPTESTLPGKHQPTAGATGKNKPHKPVGHRSVPSLGSPARAGTKKKSPSRKPGGTLH